MPPQYLGGKQQDGLTSGEAYSHDSLEAKFRKQREEYLAKDLQRQIRQIDDNVRRIDETLERLERERQPSPMLNDLRNARDENIRKKVELTNGAHLQDANDVDVEEMRKEVQKRHANGEATDEELLATGAKDFGRNDTELAKAMHNTYRYEELFDDQEDGSTILTFPEDVIAAMGLTEGDNLAISAVNGSLIIKKI